MARGILAAAALVAAAGSAGAAEPVKIGLIRSMFRGMPESMAHGLSKPFQRLLESRSGVTGELAVCADAAELARKIDAGEIHIGVFHGFEFARARQAHPELRPLAVASPAAGKLRSYLVVRRADGLTEPSDLNGKKVALPGCCRPECGVHLDALRALSPEPLVPAEVVASDAVETALDDVVDGVVDAAVVDGASLTAFAGSKPGRYRRLAALDRTGEFPPSVVAYRKGVLPAEVLRGFRDGLVTADRTPVGKSLMSLWRLRGFARVDRAFIDQLESINAAYPPPPELTASAVGE